MITRFHNAPLVHHVNDIGPHRRGKAVGDQDHRVTGSVSAKSVKPVHLSSRVHGAGGLIKNNERCTTQERSRQRNALPFTHTQLSAAGKPPTQERIITQRQATDQLICPGSPGSALDFSCGVDRL